VTTKRVSNDGDTAEARTPAGGGDNTAEARTPAGGGKSAAKARTRTGGGTKTTTARTRAGGTNTSAEGGVNAATGGGVGTAEAAGRATRNGRRRQNSRPPAMRSPERVGSPPSPPLAAIEPVSRESTAAIIARQLREAITNGLLPPGAQLGEAELAAQFEVSRGPLREAMQRLVSEGLLRSERHRGLFVIDLEPEDVHDIYTARLAIEREAVLLVLRGDRERAAERLAEAVQEMSDAADGAEVSQADVRFHEVLVAESGSKRLQRMARTLLIETRMCLSALGRTYSSNEERVTEHKRITEAIGDGDEEAALSLLEAHMEDAVHRLAPGLKLRG
jgi:DNA-binding GntR family transcriptional regulator